MLPDFLLIGAMKAGTTSLWHFMRHHPQIFMPRRKELDFFSHEQNWARGVGWYERRFRLVATHPSARRISAIGEASTSYSKFPRHPNVPARIARVIPEARFIYLVREPVERMRSQWEHMVRHWGEERPLDIALVEDPRYMAFSRYATQIECYLEHFDRSRFLVMTTEGLEADRAGTCRRAFDFVGVDPEWDGMSGLKDRLVSARLSKGPSSQVQSRLARRHPRLGDMLRGTRAVRRRVKHLVGQVHRPAETPQVADDVADHIREQLKGEVARLRDYVDGEFDGWGIA